MLSKCANPTCSATFRYLREGKILLVESVPANPGNLAADCAPRREHFWLCDSCSKTLTIISDPSGTSVVSLKDQSKASGQRKAAHSGLGSA